VVLVLLCVRNIISELVSLSGFAICLISLPLHVNVVHFLLFFSRFCWLLYIFVHVFGGYYFNAVLSVVL
jgi:hypothetical protein